MPNPIGRPTAITEDVLRKLEEAFSVGASDSEACFQADIAMSTLYKYQVEHPEYIERKAALKDQPKYQAKKVVVEAVQKGDEDMARWYLERKVKNEFAQRQENTGADGEPLQIKVTNYGDNATLPIQSKAVPTPPVESN